MSCGFHLRGSIQLDQHALPIYLFNDDGFHDIRRKLVRLFKQSNILTTSNETSAASIIKIKKVSQNNQVLSVDSLGRTREYKLISIVDFTLTMGDESDSKNIRVTRDVGFDPANILSYKKEAKILFDEMLSEQARLMMLQLQAKSTQLQSKIDK